MNSPRPTNLRAFSVAEFSLVHRALREIRAVHAQTNTGNSSDESRLFSEKIREILESTNSETCQH